MSEFFDQLESIAMEEARDRAIAEVRSVREFDEEMLREERQDRLDRFSQEEFDAVNKKLVEMERRFNAQCKITSDLKQTINRRDEQLDAVITASRKVIAERDALIRRLEEKW